MAGGRRFLLISSCLIGASCTTSHVQVRALPEPGASTKTGSALLAQARAQLAMGNVGLALESFRTLQQQEADPGETFAGIAECYAAMGRYDLARTNLEFALAYSPNDPRLLTELAATFEKLGDHVQAIDAQVEASRLRLAATAVPPATPGGVTPIGVARTGSMTVKLPEPSKHVIAATKGANKFVAHQPQAAPDAHSPMLPNVAARTDFKPTDYAKLEQSSAQIRVGSAVASSEKANAPSQTAAPSRMPPALVTKAEVTTAKAAGSPVTVTSLTERPMGTSSGMQNATAKEASTKYAGHGPHASAEPDLVADERRPATMARPDVKVEEAPHLERASRSEVALVTGSPNGRWERIDVAQAQMRLTVPSHIPQQRSQLHPQTSQVLAMTSLRWVPLKGGDQENIQLLNAAHRHGLASDTRTALLSRGWRKIAIGNSSTVRARTIVLYGRNRSHLASRLAAQFRCKTQKVFGLKSVIVLLGRDAVRHQSTSARA